MMFCSAEGLTVEISNPIVEKIIHVCMQSYPFECGGILIGLYSEDCKTASITDISSQNGKYRTRFLRIDSGLMKLLKEQWRNGKYYVGEWHYHPDNSPKPSSTDISTMHNLCTAKDLKCPEPILLIIGGSKKYWSFNLSVITKQRHIMLSQCEKDSHWDKETLKNENEKVD